MAGAVATGLSLRTSSCGRQGRGRAGPLADGAAQGGASQSEESAARWKRQAEQGGSLFDLHKDSADPIARVLIESVRLPRAETIARAILKEVKRIK